MSEYTGKFSTDITADQRTALIWKIEGDFRKANLSMRACKDEYIAYAVRFYTRNRFSIQDIMDQYAAHTLSHIPPQVAKEHMASAL